MPSPKRESTDDFFERLEAHQRPHLEQLRGLSLEFVPQVSEVLRWNQPAYLREGTQLWMLQAFGKHCSLRFTPAFFADHVAEVNAAGYEAGAGFLKILYTQQVPATLCRRLIEARLASE